MAAGYGCALPELARIARRVGRMAALLAAVLVVGGWLIRRVQRRGE